MSLNENKFKLRSGAARRASGSSMYRRLSGIGAIDGVHAKHPPQDVIKIINK
jgi:hypothetical protein